MDLVNIGIGGLYLGLMMVMRVLILIDVLFDVHYVVNVDGNDLVLVLRVVDFECMLFLIVLKIFIMEEIMVNVIFVKVWMVSMLGEEVIEKYFVGISNNLDVVRVFGIVLVCTFYFVDWVGGRFFFWLSIGLFIMMVIGIEVFEYLLVGVHVMDKYFAIVLMKGNLFVFMVFIDIWNCSFLNLFVRVVLFYNECL